MQSISLFLVITEGADFWLKNADIIITKVVCHVIHKFSGYSLGKV